jgi:DNA-binding NtrC family response regulator
MMYTNSQVQVDDGAQLVKSWDNSELDAPTVAVAPRSGPHSAPLLVTDNARMKRLLRDLESIASSESTVLIQGESGTGKEVIARFIHASSQRQQGPFVGVNCASLPEGVLDSELFGHERGAFTGAVRQRPGRFELAQRGTLFLDEIGSAHRRVQLPLLRVLQEREYERIGGTRTLKADVRVLAASNIDLEQCVKDGTFRDDLFYRLNIIPIRLPALRDRPEDIPLFIEHFLVEARAALRQSGSPREIEGIDPEAAQALQSYPWPGNIRQLSNTLERMLVLTRSPMLRVADIPGEILHWHDDEELTALGSGATYWEARSRFDRRFLTHALERHNGVISHVADAIGMSRKNLYTRLDHLRIDVQQFRH